MLAFGATNATAAFGGIVAIVDGTAADGGTVTMSAEELAGGRFDSDGGRVLLRRSRASLIFSVLNPGI